MKEQQPFTKRVDIIDQKIVFADTVDLERQRAESRARVERERTYPMIRIEVSKVAEPGRKRSQGWRNK